MAINLIRCMSVALLLLAAAPSDAAEKRYAIPDFDKIQVLGPFEVTVRTARAISVIASGDAASLDLVSVESRGGALIIQTLTKARSAWKDKPQPSAKLMVTLPKLVGLRLLGSGSITASEIRGITTNVVLNGTGQINVKNLVSDNAAIQLNGSGKIIVAGAAKNVDANVSGSGDLDALQLAASDLKIVSSTSGRIAGKSLRTANVKHNGAGDVHIGGKPSCLVENLGAGSVSCGD